MLSLLTHTFLLLANTHSLCVFQIVVVKWVLNPNGSDMVSHHLSVASPSSISLSKFIHPTNLFLSHLSAFSTHYQCPFLPFYQTRDTRTFRVSCVTDQDPKVLLFLQFLVSTSHPLCHALDNAFFNDSNQML